MDGLHELSGGLGLWLTNWRAAGGAETPMDVLLQCEFSKNLTIIGAKPEGWTWVFEGARHLEVNGKPRHGLVQDHIDPSDWPRLSGQFDQAIATGRPQLIERLGLHGKDEGFRLCILRVPCQPPPGYSAALVEHFEWHDHFDETAEAMLTDIVAQASCAMTLDAYLNPPPGTGRLKTQLALLRDILAGKRNNGPLRPDHAIFLQMLLLGLDREYELMEDGYWHPMLQSSGA